MARIPSAFIDELLGRVDIADVVGRHVELRAAGPEFKACCPFHSEKTPSFTVSPVKQFYHCFGCGAHGTAISFLMEYDQLDFVEAVETLADMVGVEVPREHSAPDNGPSKALTLALTEVLEHVASHYHAQRETLSDYMAERGLDDTVIARFMVGYSPRRDALALDPKQLIDTGVYIERDDGNHYPRFRERLMFPIRNRKGQVIGFGGRALGDATPKYLNSPETSLFVKGHELYGLFEARQHTRRIRQLVVVEGYMDVISLHQFGFTEVVATLGTATTAEQVRLLFKSTTKLIFCFDGDRAGRAAAWKALGNALPELRDGRELRFLFLPDGEDPDSYVREHGLLGFHDALERAMALEHFLFDHLSSEVGNLDAAGRARLASLAQPMLERMPEGVYRQILNERLQQIVGLSTQRRASRQGGAGQRRAREPSHSSSPRTVQPSRMQRAMACLLHFPQLLHTLPDALTTLPESVPGQALWSMLCATIRAQPDIRPGQLLERFREHEHFAVLHRLAAQHPATAEFDEGFATPELRDALTYLHRDATRKEIAQYKRRLHELSDSEKQSLRRLLSEVAKLPAE